jgi:hypothetical protein
MKRRLVFLSLVVVLLVGIPPAGTAVAQSGARYTANVFFTSDPDDFALDTEAVAFETSEEMVVAWVIVAGVGGSPKQDFRISIEFIAPNGKPYASEWYQTNGTVTAMNEDITEDSMVRRLIRVAGEGAADKPGKWTVNAYANGDLFSVESFVLKDKTRLAGQGVTAPQRSPTGSGDAWTYLEDRGYTVFDVGSSEFEDGTPFGYAVMDMASGDLYSSQVSQQVFDSSTALSGDYPSVEIYLLDLVYTEGYDVLILVVAADWQTYTYPAGGTGRQDNDWNKFAKSLIISVRDNRTGQTLESGEATKDFIGKEFGPGTPGEPMMLFPSKSAGGGRVGAMGVNTSAFWLPADGKSTADVEVVVYDGNYERLPGVDVKFTVIGSIGGRIRPLANATDDQGVATTTYTVGRRPGKVTIVATAGKDKASAIIIVGKGRDNAANEAAANDANEVVAILSSQGYTVNGASVSNDRSGKDTGVVIVDMDMVSDQINEDTLRQVTYGWLALVKSYPNAQRLVTLLRWQNYSLFWSITSLDFNVFLNEEINEKTFKKQMLNNLEVVDMTTGEEVRPDDLFGKQF